MIANYYHAENQIFYHINKIAGYRTDRLDVGQVIQTSDAFNPMRQSWEKYYTSMGDPINAAKSYWRFAKEQTFEEVRRSIDTELPSRLTSIWLTDAEGIAYWKKTLGVANSHALPHSPRLEASLLKVVVTGKIFIGDAHWYETGFETYPLNYIRERAAKYWTGEIVNQSQVECLLDGKMKIVDKLIL